jgi:hypothetical protein
MDSQLDNAYEVDSRPHTWSLAAVDWIARNSCQ